MNKFNIRQSVFDEDGLFTDQALAYREQVIDLFDQSVEGQRITADNQGEDLIWAYHMMTFAHEYLGIDLFDITADDLEEILFEIFPRKMSAPAEDVPKIVPELIGFFEFLGREFQFEHTDGCLKLMRKANTLENLQKAMNNPANFGMAKSLVMQMFKQGIDPTDENSVNQFISDYNRQLVSSPPSMGFPSSSLWNSTSGKNTSADKAKKAKKKMAKESRHKNRKKKK